MLMTQSRSAYTWLLGLGLVANLAIIGCGGGTSINTTEKDQNEENNSSQNISSNNPQTNTAPPVQSSVPVSGPSGLVHTKGGQKWVDDVPYDVFYPNPLSVAAEAGTVATPTTVASANPTPMATPTPMPMATPMASGGGLNWKRIIPAELLDAEVTSIRNRFNADLQTVGSYNRSYLSLPPHIATLTVLSHVANDHPDDIRWKKNAKFIKHLAGKMNAEKLRSGAGSQKPLKADFDNILEVLNGSVPAGVEAPDGESVAELAEMGYIMKRFENSTRILGTNGGTAEAMKTNADVLKQEAAVMGALTQILMDEGYGFAEDEGFEKFVNNMVEATVEMRDAVQNDQFEKFDLARSKVTQSCQQCHSEYRG